MRWLSHSKRFWMFNNHLVRLWNTKFVVSSMKWNVTKVCIGKCSMKDVKCRMSCMKKESLGLMLMMTCKRMKSSSKKMSDVPLVAHWDWECIGLYGILDQAFRHKFVPRAFDLQFQSPDSEIFFSLPEYDENQWRSKIFKPQYTRLDSQRTMMLLDEMWFPRRSLMLLWLIRVLSPLSVQNWELVTSMK